MKFRKVSILSALALIMIAGSAIAQPPPDVYREQSEIGQMFHKLGRGIVNVLTCWVEIPRQISQDWQETDPVTGLVTGTVKGVGWGFARLASGVYETVTFPLPVPPDYQPLLLPEFVVTDVWGDPIPGIAEFESNDPLYPGGAPIYPSRFQF